MDILVDLDGTLVDPKPGIIASFQYALQRLGARVPPMEELVWVIGPPLRTSFPKLLGASDRTEEAVALYRENYLSGAMYNAIVYAGIIDALEALSAAGCRLFVATAKPHHYARPILEHFGLAGHFAAIYGPELDGTNDSKADLIAHIIDREHVKPDAAIMIGDRQMDVAAAARNGMRTVGVTWGYGSVDELTAAGAASLCAAPPDLARVALRLLGSLGKSTQAMVRRSNCRIAEELSLLPSHVRCWRCPAFLDTPGGRPYGAAAFDGPSGCCFCLPPRTSVSCLIHPKSRAGRRAK